MTWGASFQCFWAHFFCHPLYVQAKPSQKVDSSKGGFLGLTFKMIMKMFCKMTMTISNCFCCCWIFFWKSLCSYCWHRLRDVPAATGIPERGFPMSGEEHGPPVRTWSAGGLKVLSYEACWRDTERHTSSSRPSDTHDVECRDIDVTTLTDLPSWIPRVWRQCGTDVCAVSWGIQRLQSPQALALRLS